jgi:hypothetical protein
LKNYLAHLVLLAAFGKAFCKAFQNGKQLWVANFTQGFA